ncbi:MAG TPA: helix-turn-helix domain-containing protein [Kofleriaceae bacterium]|nr:helix-turn-helix domain-containing protein [Kofleriaceae bacterium]
MPRQRKLLGFHRGRTRVRRRRSPEVARGEILDAAERVFGELYPDQAGLKDVADEAGVSHALVTHYFGTYDGLVEAALQRRVLALREQVIARLREAGAVSRPGELLGILFRALADPVHLRLMKYMVASERPGGNTAFALQDHGLQMIAAQVVEALAPRDAHRLIPVTEIALLTAVAAAFGYATAKFALARAVGRPPSRALDEDVQHTLGAMLQSYLHAQLGAAIPS